MNEDKKSIRQIISTVFNQDEEIISNINVSDSLTQYGMDSITSIDLVVALEEEYDITFNEEDLLLENINTIEKLEKIVFTYSS